MKKLLNYLLNKQWILRIVMCFLSDGKKEQIYIARFRAELAFWGHDVSDMTDEEIKEGIIMYIIDRPKRINWKPELVEMLKKVMVNKIKK